MPADAAFVKLVSKARMCHVVGGKGIQSVGFDSITINESSIFVSLHH